MNLGNPIEVSGSTSWPLSQSPNGPLFNTFLVVPALIAAGCLIAGLWYSYFTVQNFRYHGIVHFHGSLLALSTLGGSIAWALNTVYMRRHRWLLSCVFAMLGIASFMWISTLT